MSRLGLVFEVVVADVVELTDGDPVDVVRENALMKARAVAVDGAMVIGGDTVIVHRGDVIGKPANADEALATIKRLSGQDHEVLGAVAVISANREERTATTATKVKFRELTAGLMASYVATGEWQDRSGGYAIQRGGSILVESIEGDYLNIIGLSVNDLRKLAPELGI